MGFGNSFWILDLITYNFLFFFFQVHFVIFFKDVKFIVNYIL